MRTRLTALLTFAVVSFPSIAAAQSGGDVIQPAPAALSAPSIEKSPRVGISLGYRTIRSERGLSSEIEWRSEDAASTVVELNKTSRKYGFSDSSFSSQSRSSMITIMMGKRFTHRGQRIEPFAQATVGATIISYSSTWTSTIFGKTSNHSSSGSDFRPAADASVGATIRITKRIGLRASGGYMAVFALPVVVPIMFRHFSGGLMVTF